MTFEIDEVVNVMYLGHPGIILKLYYDKDGNQVLAWVDVPEGPPRHIGTVYLTKVDADDSVM